MAGWAVAGPDAGGPVAHPAVSAADAIASVADAMADAADAAADVADAAADMAAALRRAFLTVSTLL